MAHQIPNCRPSVLTTGTTWTWTEAPSDYPPSEGWTLTSTFVGSGGINFTLEATPRTSDYLYSYDSTTTSYESGSYKVVRQVALGDEKHNLDAAPGICTIQPDPATVVNGELKTHNEVMLEKIRCVLQGRVTDDLESYSIAGRSLTKIPMAELAKLEARYAFLVWQERHPGRPYPTVEVCFGPV